MDKESGFPQVMIFLLCLMLAFCIFGMFKSGMSSSSFVKQCSAANGTVKWGGRGGSDLCFAPDGRLIDLDQEAQK